MVLLGTYVGCVPHTGPDQTRPQLFPRAALAAGCDVVLHCNGNLQEMVAVAGEAPELTGAAAKRTDKALAARRAPEEFDVDAARNLFAKMIANERPEPRKAGS